MSQRERNRRKSLHRVQKGQLRQKQAGARTRSSRDTALGTTPPPSRPVASPPAPACAAQPAAHTPARDLIDLPLVAQRVVVRHHSLFHHAQDGRQIVLSPRRTNDLRRASPMSNEMLLPQRGISMTDAVLSATH